MATELYLSDIQLIPKTMKTFGIVLLVVGIIMTVFTGFTVITRKKVVDLGSVEVNKEDKTPIYWSPITGGVLMAAGAVILLVGVKERR
jgi:ascorbate-specific PTS system EIIC-type component UlaA